MAVQLTESAIDKATREAWEAKERRDLCDAMRPGLRLRLTPPSRKSKTGNKEWMLCCRDREGRMRRFALGTYPKMGIKSAREAAEGMRYKVRKEGADPVAERKRDRAAGRDAKAGIGTLAALLDQYEAQRGGKLKTWAEYRSRIESVFAAHLERPLAMMKRADLQMSADAWKSANSAGAAVRYIRPIIRWAAQRHYVSAELADLALPATVARRERVLDRAELKRLLPVLAASDRPQAACMRLLLLTLARRDEAAGAKWRDIDLTAGTWLIKETKNGQPHTVPLSTQAIALLRSRLPKDEDEKVMEPDPNALVFATATGRPLSNWDREAKVIMEASKTEGWTRHDLRRTGATMLGEMGELPDIIEAVLNHVAIRSPIAAVYNRSRYRPQVAAALQRLADALDEIEASAKNQGENC